MPLPCRQRVGISFSESPVSGSSRYITFGSIWSQTQRPSGVDCKPFGIPPGDLYSTFVT